MADLSSSIKLMNSEAGSQRMTRKETIKRREAFSRIPSIFLPRILHRDKDLPDGYRVFDYVIGTFSDTSIGKVCVLFTPIA